MADEYIRKADAVEECGEWYVEEGPEEGFIGTVSQMLDMFLPADVVQVVRCKDCFFHILNTIIIAQGGAVQDQKMVFVIWAREERSEHGGK